MDAPHAALGVIHGWIPAKRDGRGHCAIVSPSPDLWVPAVLSLGFSITNIFCSEDRYGAFLKEAGYSVPCGPFRRYKKRLRELYDDRYLSVVFTCTEIIQALTKEHNNAPDKRYWDFVLVPHVFYYQGGVLSPPAGWVERRVRSNHRDLGGTTDACWEVICWYPPGHTVWEPTTLAPQPWLPITACVNGRYRSSHVMSPPPVSAYSPVVLRDRGLVLPWGLFPSQQPSATVLVTDNSSPSGYGSRALHLDELCSIWDVPIPISDCLNRRPDMATSVRAIIDGPPGKILQLGTDMLLTNEFRGGDFVVVSSGNKRSRDLSNDDDVVLEASEKKRVKVDLPCQGPTSLPTNIQMDISVGLPQTLGGASKTGNTSIKTPLSSVVENTKHQLQDIGLKSSDNNEDGVVETGEVIKGDQQKADDSAVPTHIWDHFLEKSFLQNFTDREVMPSKWKRALNGFRRLGIRWWRRNLIRTFLHWRRKKLPVKREPKSTAYMKVSYVDKGGVLYPRWSWRDEKGRRIYKGWYTAKAKSSDARVRSHEMARDAIWRTAGKYCQDHSEVEDTWWSWIWGSTPFYWRWPEEYQEEVRDGQPHLFVGEPREYKRPQPAPRTKEDGERVSEKINGVREKKYIVEGLVRALIHYFYVPKGECDVRIVYNGTGCGLNSYVWAPNFGLPDVKDTLRALLPGYMQADMDIGEMFLNFMLHESMKELSGVDVNHLGPRGKDGKRVSWERWVRNWMGLKDSPFRSIQWMIRLKFEAYGDKDDPSNPFQYDRVELNLPGSEGYRPDLPWVMKIRLDNHLASEVFVYVDDGRITGHDEEACWAACRRIASKCSERGVQDASRKRTTPTTTPGSWAGSNTRTDNGVVAATVSKERWGKTQAQVRELDRLVDEADEKGGVPLKPLLRIRGYLQYVCRTYDWLTPYMKGLHLSVDSWREGRDEEGWKYPPKVLDRMKRALVEYDTKIPCRRSEEVELEEVEEKEAPTPPERVVVVPRMRRDVKAMVELTDTVEPPKVAVRATKSLLALYLPGDASGTGLGTAIYSEKGILYKSAMWETTYAQESSNFREAYNLTMELIGLIMEGQMEGREVFLITDNSVFESCFYKGYSDSPKLTDIIFDLRKAQRDGGVIVHVIHVAGKRMKEMGIDDLSRGHLMDGIIAGKHPLSFFPFNEGANERSGSKLKPWIESWWENWDGGPLVEMTKDLWFESRHVKGARLWMPPPAAMGTVMEVFNEDRIADMKTTHIFAIPRLMTHLWRKKLGKRADVIFEVATGTNHFWDKTQHEPLIIAIVFPLSHTANYRGPWTAKGTAHVDAVSEELVQGFKYHHANESGEFPKLARSVRDMWKDPEGRSRDILQQLLATTRKFPPVRECLVRRVLSASGKRSISEATGCGGPRGGKRPRDG